MTIDGRSSRYSVNGVGEAVLKPLEPGQATPQRFSTGFDYANS